jgi:alkylated DNA repair dioxygenase AlkB
MKENSSLKATSRYDTEQEEAEGDTPTTNYLKPAMPDVLIPRSHACATSQASGQPTPAKHLQATPVLQLMHKMRWVTLGYQYDWTRKLYPLDSPAPFPQDIANFAISVVKQLEQVPDVDGLVKYPAEKYTCQAGVINIYHTKDALMAHVDRSEECMDAPLVSLRYKLRCSRILYHTDIFIRQAWDMPVFT